MQDHKRKRYDLDDSDDEEISFGRQVLPVANLPLDFSGDPEDGMQYLFMVRRDARQLPHVTRVLNPYEKPETPANISLDQPAHVPLPSAQWRQKYETRFRHFRQNTTQPTIRVSSKSTLKLIPDKKDRDAWWAFLTGKPESEWNPPKRSKQYKQKYISSTRAYTDDPVAHHQVELLREEPDTPRQETWTINEDGDVELAQTSAVVDWARAPAEATVPDGREPTPTLLEHIDERMALHLLMYFAHWLNLFVDSPGTSPLIPTACHARWIFSLLARVDDYVSADDMSHLRDLARACIALIRIRLSPEAPLIRERLATGDMMSNTSCWIIITTIAQVWAQRDLWMDAEEMLKSVAPVSPMDQMSS